MRVALEKLKEARIQKVCYISPLLLLLHDRVQIIYLLIFSSLLSKFIIKMTVPKPWWWMKEWQRGKLSKIYWRKITMSPVLTGLLSRRFLPYLWVNCQILYRRILCSMSSLPNSIGEFVAWKRQLCFYHAHCTVYVGTLYIVLMLRFLCKYYM